MRTETKIPIELEIYLTSLDKALGAISISEKAEIITEIKSHVLEAKSRDEEANIRDILVALGDAEQVANRYLMERGLKPQKQKTSSSPMIKWLTLGFLGTLTILAFLLVFFVSNFTPLIKVDEEKGSVKILGGLIDINDINDNNDNKREIQSSPESKGEKTWSQASLKKIKILSGSGNIEVFENENDKEIDETKIKLDWEKISGNEDCQVLIREGLSDEIIIEQNNTTFRSNCQINFKLGLGKNSIKDLKNLNLKAGSGDISLTHLVYEKSELEISVGSGNISLSKVFFKEMNLKTGSGNITISLAEQILATTEGKLELITGSGDTLISMPKASVFSLSHKSGSGSLNNKLDLNAMLSLKPQFKIDHKAGSGDLDIRAND